MEVEKYNPFIVKPLPKTKTKRKPLTKAIRLSQSQRLNLKLEVGEPWAKGEAPLSLENKKN